MRLQLPVDPENTRNGWISMRKQVLKMGFSIARAVPSAWQFMRKRPVIATGCGLALVLATGFIVAAARVPVAVVCDGEIREVRVWNRQVASAIKAAEIALQPHDETNPPLGGRLGESLTVNVIRAIPVLIRADGKETKVEITPRTPREVAASAGIAVGTADRVVPDGDTPVKPGDVVRIVRVTTKKVTRTVVASYKTESRPDPSMVRGQVKVIRPGQSGTKEQTLQYTIEDGRVVRTAVIEERIIKEPQKKVIAVGTKPPIYSLVTSRGTYQYSRMLPMTATAYYPGPESCGPNATGYTRMGIKAQYGVVAVDPRVIPLGTRLYVEGYGPALAADTGSAIKGQKIDLCFDTYREARLYGKKKIKVYILVKG